MKKTYLLILFLCIIFSGCNKDNDVEIKDNYMDFKFEEPEVKGNTYYIDPNTGTINGDGSKENPWRTLQEVIENNLIQHYKHTESYNPESEWVLVNEDAPVKGGDKLILKNGYHGHVNLQTFMFEDWLTISGAENEMPVLSQFKIIGAFKNIYLKNFTIIKDSYEGSENYWETEEINRNSGSCLYLASNNFWGKGSYAKINDLTLKTTNDASAWTKNDWVQKSASGIGLRSVEHIEILNCEIDNIRHGITIEYYSNHSKAVNNTITNFCGDGSRIISNDVFFAYNTIIGCLKVDGNHDDGIQSYSRGEDNSPGTGAISDVIIRGNLIIGINDKTDPLAGSPQGIGCFDGFFENWIVENNVVISNTYHGISFYGMKNSKILNNTVIDQIPDDNVSPWIMITDHKNGTPSENCVVANNLVSSSINISGNNVKEYSNYLFGKNNYDTIYKAFTNPDANDFHINPNDFTNKNIIDLGTYFDGYISSETDKDSKVRDSKPDIGAYEVSD